MKVIANAAAAIGSLFNLFGGAVNTPSDRPSRSHSNFNPNARWRQSEASKKYHLDRAKAKRARKGEINRQRVICGEMESIGGVKLKGAKFYIDGEEIVPTKLEMSPEMFATLSATVTVDDGEYRDPTGKLTSKADLLKLAETRHVKVYPSWTRDKIVEALNAAL